GQTEASVYVTLQPDGEVYPDTVGKPGPDVEIAIAGNGEVLYRSPGVFLEYYKNDEATRATKTPDGWVHTGDAGFLDQRAVGSWAERNNVAYASYQQLAAHPQVYDMVLKRLVEVNRQLAEEAQM